MNEYRIHYTTKDEETGYVDIIERSDEAAKKVFKNMYPKAAITNSELRQAHVPATKQQERDTLDAIRRMIAELGKNSYLASAFDGCFEIAEQNIEYDEGGSMKERAEKAEQEFDAAKAALAEAESKLDSLADENNQLRAGQDALKEQIAGMKAQILPATLHASVSNIVDGRLRETQKRMQELADTMAFCADNPQCVGFQNALAEYKLLKELREQCEAASAALDEIHAERI